MMASALHSTTLVPSDASDQRSGPVVATAPLAPVDATQEPSKPPQPTVQLQVGATANAVMCGGARQASTQDSGSGVNR